jgi:hypothetical protein
MLELLLTPTSTSTNESTCPPMFIDSILLLWSQSLDAKFYRNNFEKKLTDVVSDFAKFLNFQIVNSNI